MQVCDCGRKVQKHVRVASRTRGTITIKQEDDPTRHRSILVARLSPSQGQRRIRPLYDVQLLGCTGETWTLAGQERIEAGPLQRETTVAQTWMLELAVVDELISVSQRLNAAAGEAHALREQLAALQAQAGASPGAAAREPLP